MKNWKKVKLGSLLTESKIISEIPNTDNRIRVKLNVSGIEKRPVTKDKKGATKYYIRKAGQFIYGKQNLHKGAFGIIPEELNGFESSSDIPAFDVDESCYPEWIYYFFRKGDFYLKLENLAKGVGSKRIQPKQIYGLDIYLPTKQEQRKILDQIEKVEIKNQYLFKEIQLQEENLTKLRQSILNDSIKGELTKEWREQNTDIEFAAELLKKINISNEKLIKEKKAKREKVLPSISKGEIPYEIPKSWKWERLGNIKNPRKSISYGVLMPGANINDGTPLIRVGDLNLAGTGKLPEKYISNEINLKYKKTVIEGDEILITVVGSTIGKTVISDIKWKGANIARAIARLKVHDLLETRYFYLVIISPYIQSIFAKASRTIGQPTLNISVIENTIVPIPPIEEQQIIIEKVNQLILHCNELELETIANREKSEKLIQSVLIELLRDENNILINAKPIEEIKETPSREIKYNGKTTNMNLIKLLKVNGKLHAEDLWKMSEHYDEKNINDSIDKFYSDLKTKIEIEKTIKEVTNEKGYIELV